MKAFEDTVLGFDVDAWASQKLNDVGADGNYRRSCVFIPQGAYRGEERVFSTRHMA